MGGGIIIYYRIFTRSLVSHVSPSLLIFSGFFPLDGEPIKADESHPPFPYQSLLTTSRKYLLRVYSTPNSQCSNDLEINNREGKVGQMCGVVRLPEHIYILLIIYKIMYKVQQPPLLLFIYIHLILIHLVRKK